MDVVVVNYHTPVDLERFLLTVSKWPPTQPATLTVVDVASEEREESFEWANGEGLLIGVPDNIGYARACNLAAARGEGEIIALFNADIEVTPGSLAACESALAGHPRWGVLGPCQVDEANRIRHAGIFGNLDAPVHRGWNEVNRGQYGDTRVAVTVAGSAYFVKRDLWSELTDCPLYREVAPDALGAFLPTPHYYEETWACYHAQAHGREVMYFGGVTMVHKWHRASPIGGYAEQQMPISRAMFHRACDRHDIPHD
jgi:GT2 family glycosyltransferase